MQEDARRAVDHAYRHEWARVFAATTRTARDLDLAEESVQDAFIEAMSAWARDGVPESPGAWLTTTAKRRAIDAIRRASAYRAKLPLLIESDSTSDLGISEATESHEESLVADDTMRLVLMCCHPSLSSEAQMALTLRLVCGMSTPDIARSFLVSESTMAARLTRAKKKISIARIPFRVPGASDLPARLDAALGVIYLLFTIGHTAPTGGTLVRKETIGESIRLARLFHELFPDEHEVGGLLAMFLVNDARRESRTADDGRARRISEQDRSTWDQGMIREAHDLINNSLQAGPPGRYTLQAAIALLHAEAPSFNEVDWAQIVRLYDALVIVWPNPVVQLNRAVALSKTSGPEIALKVVEDLETDGRLDRYQYLPAIKAYLLEQLGRGEEAEAARTRAFDLAANEVERDFLGEQLR
jgi:RNA polymerase sigma factor (sigma-70 family)